MYYQVEVGRTMKAESADGEESLEANTERWEGEESTVGSVEDALANL